MARDRGEIEALSRPLTSAPAARTAPRRRPRRRCRAAHRRDDRERPGDDGAERRRASRSGRGPSPASGRCRSAVASTGPAWTGRPQASAVNWQSRAFFVPPPTTWIVRIVVPRIASSRSIAQRYFSARLSRAQRTNAPSSAGGGWPVRVQKAASRGGHVAGGEERGVVGIDQRGERPGGLGAGRSAPRRRSRGRPRPGPAAFLDEPEAHDVLQQPRRPGDAPLVGEVVPERLGVDDRAGGPRRRAATTSPS